MCHQYEKLLHSEGEWKCKARQYESAGEDWSKRYKRLEDMLKGVFEMFDSTASKATDYESLLKFNFIILFFVSLFEILQQIRVVCFYKLL